MDVSFERLKTIIGDGLENAFQEVAKVRIDLANGPKDFSIRVFEMPDGKYFSELSHYIGDRTKVDRISPPELRRGKRFKMLSNPN